MWQKHPVELCARVQTVYDLRNAATGDTLCNYDGAKQGKHKSLVHNKTLFCKFSSSYMHCFISHILLQSKTDRKD